MEPKTFLKLSTGFLFCIIILSASFVYAQDAPGIKLHFPIFESKIGTLSLGATEIASIRYSDKTNQVLSFNPILFEFKINKSNFVQIGMYFNLFNPREEKLENLQILETSYLHEFASTSNTLFFVKFSHKYSLGYFEDSNLHENITHLSLNYFYKIWDLSDDGVRVFAKLGLGYYYNDKKLIPHFYIGLSLGRGISLSFDVISLFVKYKSNTFLGNSIMLR